MHKERADEPLVVRLVRRVPALPLIPGATRRSPKTLLCSPLPPPQRAVPLPRLPSLLDIPLQQLDGALLDQGQDEGKRGDPDRCGCDCKDLLQDRVHAVLVLLGDVLEDRQDDDIPDLRPQQGL